MAHSLRSLGSAALNFSMVAQGGMDLYWYLTFFPSSLWSSKFNAHREIGCWPWDVCAGIVIAEEAGGAVVGSHSDVAAASDKTFGDVTEEILTGRKYLVIRAVGDTEV